MKSLYESLFDNDLADKTKDAVCFGDLYKYNRGWYDRGCIMENIDIQENLLHNRFYSDYHEGFETNSLITFILNLKFKNSFKRCDFLKLLKEELNKNKKPSGKINISTTLWDERGNIVTGGANVDLYTFKGYISVNIGSGPSSRLWFEAQFDKK